eukprot:Protomagalhaensia_sp_Gyna_25__2816@NODE_2630_length_974_cov_10_267380_g2191_i0_p1_GENE_NODE_2630_length_974_cov_10_267380_g2191_i0NODE_2630_length_974_cov_10_267380_g2191_i0_p1_ORF_typecomplete_len192_score8_46UreE_C/PF05194_12/1_9_NODE_2630_length_974_cov_10_267380_g2191_i0298873
MGASEGITHELETEIVHIDESKMEAECEAEIRAEVQKFLGAGTAVDKTTQAGVGRHIHDHQHAHVHNHQHRHAFSNEAFPIPAVLAPSDASSSRQSSRPRRTGCDFRHSQGMNSSKSPRQPPHALARSLTLEPHMLVGRSPSQRLSTADSDSASNSEYFMGSGRLFDSQHLVSRIDAHRAFRQKSLTLSKR